MSALEQEESLERKIQPKLKEQTFQHRKIAISVTEEVNVGALCVLDQVNFRAKPVWHVANSSSHFS